MLHTLDTSIVIHSDTDAAIEISKALYRQSVPNALPPLPIRELASDAWLPCEAPFACAFLRELSRASLQALPYFLKPHRLGADLRERGRVRSCRQPRQRT